MVGTLRPLATAIEQKPCGLAVRVRPRHGVRLDTDDPVQSHAAANVVAAFETRWERVDDSQDPASANGDMVENLHALLV